MTSIGVDIQSDDMAEAAWIAVPDYEPQKLIAVPCNKTDSFLAAQVMGKLAPGVCNFRGEATLIQLPQTLKVPGAILAQLHGTSESVFHNRCRAAFLSGN